jgi:hypothetical protein
MIRLIHALTQNLCVRCHECSPVHVERLASRQIPFQEEEAEGMMMHHATYGSDNTCQSKIYCIVEAF